MNYITEFFDDKYNFWNSGTIACIFILSIICIADYITTLQILSISGGMEMNPFMRPFTSSPLLLLAIKLLGINIIICLIKLMYDIIQHKFYTKYNKLCIYFAFAIPSGATLIIVLCNYVVLSCA
jgi:hypothetical protein